MKNQTAVTREENEVKVTDVTNAHTMELNAKIEKLEANRKLFSYCAYALLEYAGYVQESQSQNGYRGALPLLIGHIMETELTEDS